MAYRARQKPPLSRAALATQLGMDRVNLWRIEIEGQELTRKQLIQFRDLGIPLKKLEPELTRKPRAA
jgi:transcriptional regulator with XRE-family HTH domain